MSENIRLCSFDIKNMYSNVPTQDLNDLIIDIARKNQIHSEIIQEIEKLAKLIIKLF
jgi:hypothetical protein